MQLPDFVPVESVRAFWRQPNRRLFTASSSSSSSSSSIVVVSPRSTEHATRALRRAERILRALASTSSPSPPSPPHLELWLTPGVKRPPLHPETQALMPEHVNSGITRRSSPGGGGDVVVYREHEWPKVFAHECIHALNLDFLGSSIMGVDVDVDETALRALCERVAKEHLGGGDGVPRAWLDTLRDRDTRMTAVNEGFTEASAEFLLLPPGNDLRSAARRALDVLRQTWAAVARPSAPAPQTPVLGYLVLKAAVAAIAALSSSSDIRSRLLTCAASRAAGPAAWLRALAQMLPPASASPTAATPAPVFRLWASAAGGGTRRDSSSSRNLRFFPDVYLRTHRRR